MAVAPLLAAAFLLLISDFGSPPAVSAAPIIDIDRVYGYTICDDKPGTTGLTFQGYPTDSRPDPLQLGGTCPNSVPQHYYSLWIDYQMSAGYDYWIGIYDSARGIWVASTFIDGWTSCNCTWIATWTPHFKSDCTTNAAFTTCADSYTVYSYWAQDGSSTWYNYDTVRGLVNGDWDRTGDDDWNHFHWSPNGYQRPTKTANGIDYIRMNWRFGYYNNLSSGGTAGTDRLNRLKNWAGSFQVEMRRNSEGWDAQSWTWNPGQLSCSKGPIYSWYTNIPGFEVTEAQIEENDCFADEEAQGKTTSESSWSTFNLSPPGIDASYTNTSGYYWYWTQTFYRKLPNRGQSFRLQTEYELNESPCYPPLPICPGEALPPSYDTVAATQRSESY